MKNPNPFRSHFSFLDDSQLPLRDPPRSKSDLLRSITAEQILSADPSKSYSQRLIEKDIRIGQLKNRLDDSQSRNMELRKRIEFLERKLKRLGS